ncbi:MAG: hypothetical protein DYG92_04310 [Leptolyngbya sp. PLA1]|nr:hypothetical protein [Leptolyngbya sp. PLA1]
MGHHAHTPAPHEHADSWHHHAPEEGRPQHEHAAVVNTMSLTRWFVLLVIALVTVIVVISVYFTSAVTRMKAQRIETNTLSADVSREKARTAAILATGKDPSGAAVQLPIEQAMDQVVSKYQNRK